MLRRLLPLLVLLTACATPPAPAPVTPPLPYPPAAAERVLRLALDEWREWGGVTRDAYGPPLTGSPEANPGNFPRILAYWRAVDHDEGAIRDNRPRYAAALAGLPADRALWSEPAWSAAFISWVFRTAGVDAREFPPNAAHALYLDPLITDAARFPATAPFIPRAPEEHAPRPGDLVCFDRSRAPLRHWTERLAETGRFRPMHCDIAVNTPPGAVEVIGGNVADGVTMTRYPADPDGPISPPPPGRTPVLLIMESRLGRLPPWSSLATGRRSAPVLAAR